MQLESPGMSLLLDCFCLQFLRVAVHIWPLKLLSLCLVWHRTPLVSPDNLLVTSVNSVGAVFQLAYIVLFVIYTEKEKKFRMLGWILTVFGLFAIVVLGSLFILDVELRRIIIGSLSCASLISMFASPLLIINLVIRTRSVEFMPFCLSLSTFLMSASFFLYGIFSFDPFIYVPNGIGTLLGVVQLLLFAHYRNSSRGDSAEGFIVSYS